MVKRERVPLLLPLAGCLAVGLLYQTAWADSGCPKQCCSTGVSCGGEDASPLSICSPEQGGKACNGCDGTTSVRLCASCVQDRKCTMKDGDPTKCGKPFTGICTKATLGYYYCKKTAAGGTHKCEIKECTGDKAC